MPITLSDNITAFVFGSALEPDRRPRDLDVLFLYDPAQLPPQMAYAALRPPIAQLSEMTGLSVHPTILGIEEEQRDGFRTRTEVMPLAEWLKTHPPFKLRPRPSDARRCGS